MDLDASKLTALERIGLVADVLGVIKYTTNKQPKIARKSGIARRCLFEKDT